jgi:hypothetical protein
MSLEKLAPQLAARLGARFVPVVGQVLAVIGMSASAVNIAKTNSKFNRDLARGDYNTKDLDDALYAYPDIILGKGTSHALVNVAGTAWKSVKTYGRHCISHGGSSLSNCLHHSGKAALKYGKKAVVTAAKDSFNCMKKNAAKCMVNAEKAILKAHIAVEKYVGKFVFNFGKGIVMSVKDTGKSAVDWWKNRIKDEKKCAAMGVSKCYAMKKGSRDLQIKTLQKAIKKECAWSHGNYIRCKYLQISLLSSATGGRVTDWLAARGITDRKLLDWVSKPNQYFFGPRIKLAIKYGKKIYAFGKGAVNKAKNAWKGGKNVAKKIFNRGEKLWNGTKKGVDAIVNRGHELWNSGKQRARKIAKFGKKLIKNGKKFAGKVGKNIAKFGKKILKTGNVGKSVKKIFKKGKNLIGKVGKNVFKRGKKFVGKVGKSVIKGGKKVFKSGRKFVGKVGKSVIKGGKKFVGKVGHKAKKFVGKVYHGGHKIFHKAVHHVHKVVRKVSRPVRKVVHKTFHKVHKAVHKAVHPVHKVIHKAVHRGKKVVRKAVHRGKTVVKRGKHVVKKVGKTIKKIF